MILAVLSMLHGKQEGTPSCLFVCLLETVKSFRFLADNKYIEHKPGENGLMAQSKRNRFSVG